MWVVFDRFVNISIEVKNQARAASTKRLQGGWKLSMQMAEDHQ